MTSRWCGLGSEWVDPEDPTVIAETELLGAAASIEAAAKKLEQLKPRAKPKVGLPVPFSTNSNTSLHTSQTRPPPQNTPIYSGRLPGPKITKVYIDFKVQ